MTTGMNGANDANPVSPSIGEVAAREAACRNLLAIDKPFPV